MDTGLSLIRKWSTHGDIYLEGCKKADIEPNFRALPKNTENGTKVSTNESEFIMKFVQATPKWTSEGLLDHIIEPFVSNGPISNRDFKQLSVVL